MSIPLMILIGCCVVSAVVGALLSVRRVQQQVDDDPVEFPPDEGEWRP